MLKFILAGLLLINLFHSFGQKISARELLEEISGTILVENFYQIDLNDYNNFISPVSTGFQEKEKCYIQNFQSEDKLKGQLLIQLDFTGRIQYLGIAKVFIDKYRKISKSKMILINELENCTSEINANWQIANCLSKKIIEFISD